jgi:hypothetical protein
VPSFQTSFQLYLHIHNVTIQKVYAIASVFTHICSAAVAIYNTSPVTYSLPQNNHFETFPNTLRPPALTAGGSFLRRLMLPQRHIVRRAHQKACVDNKKPRLVD